MAAPRYYSYSPETGEYAGSAFARENPLEPGAFMFPALTTTIAPPEVGALQVACFNPDNQQWSLVPDRRGQTFYTTADGRPMRVQEIGDPREHGLTHLQPPPMGARQALLWAGEDWAVIPDRRGERWYNPSGVPVEIEAVGDPADLGLTEEPPDLRTDEEKLTDRRVAARDRVRVMLNRASTAILAPYPEAEVLGWTAKEIEAQRVLAGPLGLGLAPVLEEECRAEAPSILGDAALLNAVLAKAKSVAARAGQFRAATGRIAGLRQRFAVELEGARSVNQVDAVLAAAQSELGLT